MSWTRSFCAVVFLLAICLPYESAFGRAGGGGGFSGGGGGFSGGGGGFSGGGGGFSGGGSSYSSGGGGGDAEFLVVMFVVCLPVVLTFVVCGYFQNKATNKRKKTDVYRSRLKEQDVAVTTIRANDPVFSPERFRNRFVRAFAQIQEAWSRQDLRPIRHFVSDGIYERFSLQIQEQRDMGYRDHMEQIRTKSVRLAEATTSYPFDVLTVEVTASAIDFRESIETGEYLSGSRSPSHFTEFWSFVRRRGVQSAANKLGLIEGHCPNCGDSLAINQAESCSSCDALLRSGEYDWVLSEITQGCVWRPSKEDETDGVDRYRAGNDPGFNMQHIEDRASVIFWRMAMAERLQTTRPLLKVATHEFCKNFIDSRHSESESGERRFCGGCSVGSMELEGVVEADDYDYALIDVHWSANVHSVELNGSIRDLGGWRRYQSLLVLKRKRGVRTKIDRAIDSAHCPRCGAPESDVASDACGFCDSVLNDGSHDWVLSECRDRHSDAAKTWLLRAKRSLPREKNAAFPDDGPSGAEQPRRGEDFSPSYADLLAWTISVFAADNVFDDREREVILHLANKQGMPKAMLKDLIKNARRGELDAPGPSTPACSRVWLGMIVDVALLDGKVEPDELKVLADVGKRVGFERAEVNLMIDKRRAARTRESESDFFDEALREAGIDL